MSRRVMDRVRVDESAADSVKRNGLMFCRHTVLIDAVEDAMEDEHGPDTSQHPPNDFDLWGKATRGKKKGKLVGLGTRGDPRLMVTSRTSSSSSSSHAHHTIHNLSEQV
ncbi:hypothetical protein Tco_0623433 [Tanacetum coccineum]